MIRIKITENFFRDLFIPNKLGFINCVQGLPTNIGDLVDVEHRDGLIELVFDDGDYEHITERLIVIDYNTLGNTSKIKNTGFSDPNDAFEAGKTVI